MKTYILECFDNNVIPNEIAIECKNLSSATKKLLLLLFRQYNFDTYNFSRINKNSNKIITVGENGRQKFTVYEAKQ